MPSSYTDPTVPLPNIQRLARDGVWAEGVVGVVPSATFPSHTTLITGVAPATHGIVDNRVFDPENRSNGAWHWYAREIRVPTLPMAARARGLRAAAIAWPATVGMDLDQLVPDFWHSSHAENLMLLDALSWPRGLLDAAQTALDRRFEIGLSDRDRADVAAFVLRTFDPHVLLLHLVGLDGAQHAGGPGSPEADAALVRMDEYLGTVLDAVAASGRASRTHVAVVSDHGFLPVKSLLQPNAALREAGLLTVNEDGSLESWRAYYHASGGAGFVYVKDVAAAEQADDVLRELARDPRHGIRRIWTREELDAMGAHPDAAFGLDVVDGFYTGSGHDRLVTVAPLEGGHGFAPDRPALHASFILAGPAVERRGSLGVIRMTQVAPTLATLLGVGLGPEVDSPIRLDPRPIAPRPSR